MFLIIIPLHYHNNLKPNRWGGYEIFKWKNRIQTWLKQKQLTLSKQRSCVIGQMDVTSSLWTHVMTEPVASFIDIHFRRHDNDPAKYFMPSSKSWSILLSPMKINDYKSIYLSIYLRIALMSHSLLAWSKPPFPLSLIYSFTLLPLNQWPTSHTQSLNLTYRHSLCEVLIRH